MLAGCVLRPKLLNGVVQSDYSVEPPKLIKSYCSMQHTTGAIAESDTSLGPVNAARTEFHKFACYDRKDNDLLVAKGAQCNVHNTAREFETDERRWAKAMT